VWHIVGIVRDSKHSSPAEKPQPFLWMVLKESLVLLAIGAGFGIPLSLAANRALQAGLFGVDPADPLTLIAAVLVMSAAMLAGSYIPVRRATKIDPAIALRYE
jgi:ABC-type antimicrobial peptide transport system permease subunit